MAEPLIVSAEEFHDIFGSSDEENNAADFDGSDIDVQEVDSDIEEDEIKAKATTTRMRVTLSSGQMNSRILILKSLAANKP